MDMKLRYRTGEISTGSSWTDSEEQAFGALLILLDHTENRIPILHPTIQALTKEMAK